MDFYLTASYDGCHVRRLLGPEHLVVLLAGPISHTGIQYIDFVKIFSVSLDLSTIEFVHFSGCRASFVYSYYSIPECYNLFSGVKLSVRSFCFIHENKNVRDKIFDFERRALDSFGKSHILI